jgi:hypothetical protein
MMINRLFASLLVILALAGISACTKSSGGDDPGGTNTNRLSYGADVLYMKNVTGPQIFTPNQTRPGKYIGFPEGIELNPNTGTIDIAESETGLRYKISFIPDGTNDTLTTMVLLSGINYYDHIYNLSTGDSIAYAIYNGDPARALPGTGNIFDEGNNCNGQGCAVQINSGHINLAKSIRDGALGNGVPLNDAQKEFRLRYRLDDPSQKAANELKIKLYYYQTANDIPRYLTELLQDREGTLLRTATGNMPTANDAMRGGADAQRVFAKPRPPCIIIVGH